MLQLRKAEAPIAGSHCIACGRSIGGRVSPGWWLAWTFAGVLVCEPCVRALHETLDASLVRIESTEEPGA